MSAFNVVEYGNRWLAGESLRTLAREVGVSVPLLYGRFKRAGFRLSPEEARMRQGIAMKNDQERFGGIFSRLLGDQEYEVYRQKDFDRAERRWTERLAGQAFENAKPPAMCGKLPRLETCVLSQASLADADVRSSSGHRVKQRGHSS